LVWEGVDGIMHKIKINTDIGFAARSTKIMLDDQEFKGVKALDVRMRVDEVVTITTEILPKELKMEYQDADIYIVIGDKKYRLMECVGDAYETS
jgi:hypothetical protein